MNYPLTFCKLQGNLSEEERWQRIRQLEHEEAVALDCPYQEIREYAIDSALKQKLIPRRPKPGEYICQKK
jgi:hypothetical protein